MTLTPLVAAARRASDLVTLLVPPAWLVLLITDRAALAGVLAAVGCLLLALLLPITNSAAVCAMRRITELEAELATAYTDPVTGLAVRRVAEQRLAAGDAVVTVALIDVDGMHDINTAVTHAGGDRFLAGVADRLRQASDPDDLVARLGGDEFVLITARRPREVAGRLAAAAQQPITVGSVTLPMRASVGICRMPGGDPHTALGRADRAMYTAKRRGGGIVHYDPVRDVDPSRTAGRCRTGRSASGCSAIAPSGP